MDMRLLGGLQTRKITLSAAGKKKAKEAQYIFTTKVESGKKGLIGIQGYTCEARVVQGTAQEKHCH